MPSSFKAIPLSLLAELYAASPTGSLSNIELYDRVAEASGIGTAAVNASQPIGRAQKLHSPVQRTIRWYQQTLRQMGVLERVDGQRGVWRLSEHVGKDLNRIIEDKQLIAFSTKLGVAIWSRHSDVFGSLDEPISLCVTSPPYPLRKERAYGGPSNSEFSDFMCAAMEGIVRNLQPGGSIVLVVSNDVFEERRSCPFGLPLAPRIIDTATPVHALMHYHPDEVVMRSLKKADSRFIWMDAADAQTYVLPIHAETSIVPVSLRTPNFGPTWKNVRRAWTFVRIDDYAVDEISPH